MDFQTTSRKDDMISVCYLMILLMNRFMYPLYPKFNLMKYSGADPND